MRWTGLGAFGNSVYKAHAQAFPFLFSFFFGRFLFVGLCYLYIRGIYFKDAHYSSCAAPIVCPLLSLRRQRGGCRRLRPRLGLCPLRLVSAQRYL